MNGVRFLSMMTEHYREHKSQHRQLRFIVPFGSELVPFEPVRVAAAKGGVEVRLRRVVQ